MSALTALEAAVEKLEKMIDRSEAYDSERNLPIAEVIALLKSTHLVRSAEQVELFKASGEVVLKPKMVAFLYLLMRDHLPVGPVSEIVKDLRAHDGAIFTNGWLAKYAEHVAVELSR